METIQTPKPSKAQQPKPAKSLPVPTPVGLDIGYGFVKAVTPNSTTTFPSLVAPINNSDIMLPFYQTDELVTVHGQRFLVGQPATKATFRFREQWDTWWHSPAFVALLAKVRQTIPKGSIIVSGLPLHIYNSENAQQIGTIITTQLNAKQTKIVAQGLGAYFAIVTHQPEYANAKLVLVDIGSRTTELLALSASQCLPHQCRGLVLGTQSLFAPLADKLSKDYGRNIDPYEIEASIINQTPLIIRSTTLPPSELQNELVPFLEPFLTRLHHEMVNLWGIAASNIDTSLAPDFDYMVFTGGGALLLQDQLRARYPHAIIPDQPQAANAYGFSLLAKILITNEEGGQT